MGIPPAESRLDDPVQLAEMEAPWDDEPAPDGRFDVQQGYAELHDGQFFPGDPAIMTEIAARRQSTDAAPGDERDFTWSGLLPNLGSRAPGACVRKPISEGETCWPQPVFPSESEVMAPSTSCAYSAKTAVR
jgi:hypothetical protein